MKPLYVLTRTSGRSEYYKKCRASVAALEYPNVVHIVHCDDPRSEWYIDCDILIRGEAHTKNVGSAPYNLYQNRLLRAIPGRGWVHMLDDDDMYVASDVFNWLHDDLNPDHVHVCKAARGGDIVSPRKWKKQKSFQTECFLLDSKLARRGRWWGDKGGDHYYSRQITRAAKMIEWNDVLVAKAQDGKNRGKLIDVTDYDDAYAPDKRVWIKLGSSEKNYRGGKLYQMPYKEARALEKHGYGIVTYKGTEVV